MIKDEKVIVITMEGEGGFCNRVREYRLKKFSALLPLLQKLLKNEKVYYIEIHIIERGDEDE